MNTFLSSSRSLWTVITLLAFGSVVSRNLAVLPEVATVKITYPVEGATLPAGGEVPVKAVAIDPAGYMPRLEFYLDGLLLGVSEIAFITAPPNGSPIEHSVIWKNPIVGAHKLSALGKSAQGRAIQSNTVNLKVAGDSSITVVSITAPDAVATELAPSLSSIDPAVFEITRAGNTRDALLVFFSALGTAIPGQDYRDLPANITIPAGQTSARLEVVPPPDIIPNAEPMETVFIRLEDSPLAGPRPSYQIDPSHREAGAVIFDITRPEKGALEIARPGDGAKFAPGETITVVAAVAAARTGTIRRVEFLADGQKIGVWEGEISSANGGVLFPSVTWKEAKAGRHLLAARATLVSGAQLEAHAVAITVGAEPVKAHIEILSPKDGAILLDGSEILITAEAVDPEGYISRVEFFANDRSIGVSELFFFRAPDPGTPIQHGLVWENVPEGTFVLTARATGSQGTAIGSNSPKITVRGPPAGDRVVLAVEASDPVATEPSATGIPDVGVFVIKRIAGSKSVEVPVFFQLSGKASNGVDYSEVKPSVVLPAGREKIEVVIKPLSDKALDPEETVVLTLQSPACPLIFPPPPQCYVIGTPASAQLLIRDNSAGGNQLPKVALTRPRDGAVFELGQVIELRAEAGDPDGKIERLDIWADGKLLGSTKLATLTVLWPEAAAGSHVLTARALDNSGASADSAAVRVMVESEPELTPFVERDLPAGYAPAVPLTVELRARPAKGTLAYALEDRPPKGWTVGEISDRGVFDSITGKVKFGPFTDDESRTLKYVVTPPRAAQGRYEFEGVSSAGGTSFPIAGDRVLDPPSKWHPADSNPDGHLTLDELTRYAAAWKGGQTWGTPPAAIPLAYVSRAGLIWRQGEAYSYDPKQVAPLCWVTAGHLAATASEARPSETRAVRNSSGGREITLVVSPQPGTKACAIEEKVPLGSQVTNISDHGSYDASSGTIRWGLFFDDQPRALHYDLGGLSAASGNEFRTSVSCDGVETRSTGTILRLPRLVHGRDGVHLTLEGGAGAVCILESSADLKSWTEVAPVFLPDGKLEFADEQPAASRLYYRLRAR